MARLIKRRYRPKGYFRPIRPKKFIIDIHYKTSETKNWEVSKITVFSDNAINARLLAVKIFMATPEYQEGQEILVPELEKTGND